MSDLIIGFSGTRHGMTDLQHESVTDLLKALQPAEVHHGDCVGADSEFHDLALWHTEAWVVVHPPDKDKLRAFRHVPAALGEIRTPLPYLQRNGNINAESSVLIAAPQSMTSRHGGTWYTIRSAQNRGNRVIIVRPAGEYESH